MKNIELIWHKLEDAIELPSAEREAGVQSILRELDEMPEDDPEVLFAKGYALYFHPKRLTDSERQVAAEKSLLRVLERDPSHDGARLYLGHHYYDIGQYRKALTFFTGLRNKNLNPMHYIKARELTICCLMALDELPEAATELDSFIRLSHDVSEYDILPIHLVEMGKKKLQEHRPTALTKSVYHKIRTLLSEKNQERLFSAELSELDHWSTLS